VSEVTARQGGRWCLRARSSLLLLTVAIGSISLFADAAPAEEVHVFSQTIQTPSDIDFLGLNSPSGVAVDNSSGPSAGSIYVADTNNERIVKFDSAGNFLLTWGKEVNEGTGPSDLCTNAGEPTDICKPGTEEGIGPGWVVRPTSIAVDSSSGPSAGSVHAIPYGSRIQKFDPTGNPVTAWGGVPFPSALNGSSAPDGPFNDQFGGITVEQSGNLAVFNKGRIFTFAEDGTSLNSFLPAESGGGSFAGLVADGVGNYFISSSNQKSIVKIGPTGDYLGRINVSGFFVGGLAFDAVHNDLFAVQFFPTSVNLYHFNGSGEVVQPDGSTCSPTVSANCGATENFGGEEFAGQGPRGIAVNTVTRKVYVANYIFSSESGQAINNNIKAFSLLNLPKVTTGGTSNLTRTSVKFAGDVDPDGAGEVTSCKIEFGTTKNYGSSAPCVPATLTAPAAVSSELPAETLKAATEYHYRLVAGNAEGNRAGNDLTFTTPPAVGGVTTGTATGIDRLTATLTGSFAGDGVDTSYYFEYGPTTSYGQTTPDVDHGTASGTQNIGADLTGLVAYSTYHYRLVAHNKYGKTIGGDQEFRTLPPDLPTIEKSYPSDVDQDSAILNADIDLGSGLTVYRFEYGQSESYGSKTLVDGPLDPLTADRTASTTLTGLAPGTTYHFRARATNFAGTTVGPDQTFTTPSAPIVLSASASSVSKDSAILNALIDPGLSSTTSHFEYGTTTAYGSSTPESAPIGADDVPHGVGTVVAGLAPGTTYHYRVVATNAFGTTVSADQFFTTATTPLSGGGAKGKKCRKRFVKKHGKCVRKKRKKMHHGRKGGKHG
jgi:hypothetical protein